VAAHRGWLYDRLVAGMTSGWYREVLTRLPRGTRLLDVGVGTGAAVVRCADLIRERELSVVGIDVDADYLARCERAVRRAGLSSAVSPRLESVYDHSFNAADGPYDAAYFSASLMLLPDPVAAVRRVTGLLRPGGTLYATQTFQLRRSRLVERGKPLIRYVTTIEFGRVTYEDDFRACLAAAGVELTALHTMASSRHHAYRLAIAKPVPRPAAEPVVETVADTA
jgi:ubiquinone/menaquinone biosynthesis C-methylase UbiE